MKKVFCLACLLLAASPSLVRSDQASEPGLLSVGAWPFCSLSGPAFNGVSLSTTVGLGGRIGLQYRLPSSRVFFAANAEYGQVAFFASATQKNPVSLISGSIGFGYGFPLASWLSLRASAEAGYYLGFITDRGPATGSGNPAFGLELDTLIGLGEFVGIDLFSRYRFYYNLMHRADLGVGLIYHVRPPGGIEIRQTDFDEVFPVLRSYYDTHPVGSLKIANTSAVAASSVRITLLVPQYMEVPKESEPLADLKPGEERTVQLYALFTPKILETIQDTKSVAQISVVATIGSRTTSVVKNVTLQVHHRNAMTWDPDAKAAAFVTSMDPAVMHLSNNVNAMIRGVMNKAVDKNLQIGIALHDALRVMGISYTTNPLTGYETVRKDKAAVDTLKLPRDTLSYKSGDCSDLSILYCALFESLQIETAFITIPGHIFMAFALGCTPEVARATADPEDLIFREDKVWVPIEVTERDKTFLSSWQMGMKEWRDNSQAGQAGFDRVREAWKTYPAVDPASFGASPPLPDQARLTSDFQADLTRYVQKQLTARIAVLEKARSGGSSDPRIANALGVLFARYGLAAEAEKYFKFAAGTEAFVPALVNLGNLCFLSSDLKKAADYYQKALDLSPGDPHASLGMARVREELLDYAEARRLFQNVRASAPDLAEQFSYLGKESGAATRAFDAIADRERVVWDEE